MQRLYGAFCLNATKMRHLRIANQLQTRFVTK